MWVPAWIKRAWSGFGHATRAYTFYRLVSWLVGFGVAGTVTPWAYTSALLSGMAPWPRLVFFIGVGLLIVAGVIVLLQWLAFRYKPAWLIVQPATTEPDPLREKLSETEARLSQLEGENESLRTAQARTGKEFAEAEAGFKNWKERAVELFQLQRFGEELPRFYHLEPGAHRQMVSRVHELLPDLEAMIGSAEAVWTEVTHLAKQQGESSAMGLLLARMDGAEHGNLIRICGSLGGQLQNGEDPRAYLATTYTVYRKWRNTVAGLSKLLGHAIEDTPGYAEWMDAEKRFLYELRKKLAIPELEAVRRFVREYDQVNGPPIPLESG